MRFFIAVTSAFSAGTLIGVGLGILLTEEKAKESYLESMRSYKRALDLASDRSAPESPKPEMTVVTGDIKVKPHDNAETYHQELIEYEPNAANFKPSEKNPYHNAVSAMETSTELFVSGGVNDYGVSYIEEEEYEEEDGRSKHQITMVLDDIGVPSFFMHGQQIFDWDERLGDSILVDFAEHVPPGIPPILYVRNHKTDEDYEVSREMA